jgi:DNA-directed RNA polymerase subunit E"
MASKKQQNVCRSCHRLVDGEACVMCGGTNLTDDWKGYLVVIDPRHSDIAQKMNIEAPGRVALKVR